MRDALVRGGSPDFIAPLIVEDATGTGLEGLAHDTPGLVAEYWAEGATAWTTINLVPGVLGTYTPGGFVEDSGGHYELGVPNAAWGSGRWVKVRLRGASGMQPVEMLFPLWAVDPQSSTRGLAGSALPAVAAGAPNGLPLLDANGNVPADLARWLGAVPLALVSQRVAALVGAYGAGLAPLTESETQDASALGAAAALAAYDAATQAGLNAAEAAILAAIAAQPADVLDLPDGVETGITVRQALRIILAAEAGKLSGAATTTIRIRDTGDTKDRITATVDANGNRSAVVLDAS